MLLLLAVQASGEPLPSVDPCVPKVVCKGAGTALAPNEDEVRYGPGGSPARTLDVFYTEKAPADLRPAVLMVHQGGWNGGSKDTWAARARDLATQTGWPVFTVGYAYLDPHKHQVQPADVEAAILFVKAHAADYSIDVARIGLAGSSAGAHLSMLAGMKGSGGFDAGARVAAVAEWSGPTQLQQMTRAFGCENVACPSVYTADGTTVKEGYTGGGYVQLFTGTCKPGWTTCGSSNKIERCFPGPVANGPLCPERYSDNSPVLHVDPTDPPVQIWHTQGDPVVPFDQAVLMAQTLRSAGVHVECPAVASSTDHGDALHKEAWTQTKSFLVRMLAPTPTPGATCTYTAEA